MRTTPSRASLAVSGLCALVSITALAWKCAQAADVVPTSAPATQPAGTLVATLPSGIKVELVGISNHPIDDAAWWRPDGSAIPDAPPDKLMTAQMYSGAIRTTGVPWAAGAKPYKFFVRYSTPDGKQRVTSPRVEDDVARGAHRGVGKDHFFLECIMLLPADAKAGTIRFEVGMDGVEKLIDTRDVNKSADFVVPQTDGEKITFSPQTISDGQYAVTVDCPTEVVNNDFIRPVVTVGGKDVLTTTFAPRQAPSPAITRLHYEMNAKTADVTRFRLEAYRPREYARFSQVSLEPGHITAPAAEGRAGDQWPAAIQPR